MQYGVHPQPTFIVTTPPALLHESKSVAYALTVATLTQPMLCEINLIVSFVIPTFLFGVLDGPLQDGLAQVD
jgi:hypothetical protein